MRRVTHFISALGLLALCALAFAGPPVEGALEKQAPNWHSIIIFIDDSENRQ